MTTFPTVRLNIFPNSISIIIDFFQLNKLTFILYIHHQTFTWHDIRHWLNTVYKQGGLTDLQVNALLSRKSLAQARVYDQTLAIDRSKVVQDLLTSIRQDKAIGQIQETYNILGMTDRQTAEQY